MKHRQDELQALLRAVKSRVDLEIDLLGFLVSNVNPNPSRIWGSCLGQIRIADQRDFEEAIIADDPASFLPGISGRRDERS